MLQILTTDSPLIYRFNVTVYRKPAKVGAIASESRLELIEGTISEIDL